MDLDAIACLRSGGPHFTDPEDVDELRAAIGERSLEVLEVFFAEASRTDVHPSGRILQEPDSDEANLFSGFHMQERHALRIRPDDDFLFKTEYIQGRDEPDEPGVVGKPDEARF